MALKNSFKRKGAQTSVIATVSPASKDTEHSLNTLRHACVMAGDPSASEGGGVGSVRTVAVGEVNVAAHSRRARAGNAPSDDLINSNGEYSCFSGPSRATFQRACARVPVEKRFGITSPVAH